MTFYTKVYQILVCSSFSAHSVIQWSGWRVHVAFVLHPVSCEQPICISEGSSVAHLSSSEPTRRSATKFWPPSQPCGKPCRGKSWLQHSSPSKTIDPPHTPHDALRYTLFTMRRKAISKSVWIDRKPVHKDAYKSRNFSDLHRRNSLDTAAPLHSKEDNQTDVSPSQCGSRFRDTLRQYRLQTVAFILGQLFGWKRPQERRKVAMYRSRQVAIFHSALHIVPLGGAITLLALRWQSYWIDYGFDDTLTLQFVAKFHELLMQVSIVDVMVCIIRTVAVNSFIPFGALSAAAQTTQLSYLWSVDFVSLVTSSALQGWRKALFLLAIP